MLAATEAARAHRRVAPLALDVDGSHETSVRGEREGKGDDKESLARLRELGRRDKVSFSGVQCPTAYLRFMHANVEGKGSGDSFTKWRDERGR